MVKPFATVSADCMKGLKMTVYKDDKCKEEYKVDTGKYGVKVDVPGAAGSHELTTVELDALNKKCNNLGAQEKALWKEKEPDFTASSISVDCNMLAMTSTVYADADCKGKQLPVPYVWGTCMETKIGGTKMYTAFTGAIALQAATAAALAFVGSQF